MHKVKINGQEYEIPLTVHELTLKQFFGLRRPGNDIIDEISALSGIPRVKIENFKDIGSINAAQVIVKTLGESIQRGFDTGKKPDYVFIGMKKIKVPKDLRLQPIGAFMSAHDILSDHTNTMIRQAEKQAKEQGVPFLGLDKKDINYTDCIPKVLAHYFFIHYFGESTIYSDTKAEDSDYMDKIMNMRLVDAVPIANDFFLKYPNLI